MLNSFYFVRILKTSSWTIHPFFNWYPYSIKCKSGTIWSGFLSRPELNLSWTATSPCGTSTHSGHGITVVWRFWFCLFGRPVFITFTPAVRTVSYFFAAWPIHRTGIFQYLTFIFEDISAFFTLKLFHFRYAWLFKCKCTWIFSIRKYTQTDEKNSWESEAVHPVSQNFVTSKNKILAFLQDKYIHIKLNIQ